MANTVSILSYSNTFGELVTNLNALTRENNTLAANNYTKSTGTLFLNDPGLGIQVAGGAVVEGGLVANYGNIETNLRVENQAYFTNTTIGLTNFGQANVYGLLFANASSNSIFSANNITVGGNAYVTGNIHSSNNIVVAGSATIDGTTTIYGTTNVANTLLVNQSAYVRNLVTADRVTANTSTQTPVSIVTGLLDVGQGVSQLNLVTANNVISTRGYISTLQSNTSINTGSLSATTLYANTLSTPIANVLTTLDANNATAYLKNLSVSDEFTLSGNFVIQGQTIYTSNTFELLSGTSGAYNAFYTVARGTSANSAVLRWNEIAKYWDMNDVETNSYYRVLTSQQINDTLLSTSTVLPASANVANTLYTLLNSANNYLQVAVSSAGSFGNGAFSRANSAFDAANNVAPQIAPTYDRANSAYARANTSSNTFVGTTGQITATNGSVTFTSTNGITVAGSGNTFTVNTPQDVRTTASPTFNALTLTSPLSITQGGTGGQSSTVALQNLLPSTVGVPSGYILGTTGGLGASFNWVAGGSGGGGGVQPGTRITTNRLSYTAASNQTDFATPDYVTGSGQLRVFVNGVRQYNSDYTELSSNLVRMNNALTSGDGVLVEVDGYYVWSNAANVTSFTAPYGGIVSTANTVQLAIESIESRKAPLASPSFSGVPTSSTPSTTSSNTWIATSAFVHNLANSNYTFAHNITGQAGSVVNGVVTSGSYSDPTWLTLSKSKVGLSNVDNTADANKSVSYAATAGSAGSSTTAGTATYLSASEQQNSIRGAITSLAMVKDNTSTGSFACRAAGVGDNNLAGMTFWNNDYALKMGVRADGYFGIGGWSSSPWMWYVSPDGNMAAARNVTAYSDPRLKEDFQVVEKPLDILSKLDGGTFTWKTGIAHTQAKAGEKDYGILADQVEAVMPEIVSDSVSIEGETYKTVSYEKLIPVLIEAIKELKAEIEELKGKTK